jgi:hypothetical protein
MNDQKCIRSPRKSFIEHPDALFFRRERSERVFQQLQAISHVISIRAGTAHTPPTGALSQMSRFPNLRRLVPSDGNSEVIHLDEKRPTRAVEELHQVAATRTERRQPLKLDYFRVADHTPSGEPSSRVVSAIVAIFHQSTLIDRLANEREDLTGPPIPIQM